MRLKTTAETPAGIPETPAVDGGYTVRTYGSSHSDDIDAIQIEIVSALRDCKKHGGDLCLVSPSARVAEVLELAGLTSLFSVYDDTTTAVGSF